MGQPMSQTRSDIDWLNALRETGKEVFDKTGLPTPAVEDWKYSSLRPYEKQGFQITLIQPKLGQAELPERLLPQRIVFVNGRYSERHSDDIEGLDAMSIAEYLHKSPESIRENLVDLGDLNEKPLKAFNTAHFRDGVALVLKEGQTIDQPIEILYFSTDKGMQLSPQIFSRNVFVVAANSSVQVIENYQGNGVYASHNVCDVSLGESAVFKHYRIQADTDESYNFTHTRVMQNKASEYETLTLTSGARFSRHDLECQLIAEDVRCIMKGCTMLRGEQHTATKILVDHMEPKGVSDQLYKGILDDQSRSIFQGKIHVRRAAQGTDGRQLNNALLLSEQAEVDAKPELEIYADDVECAHGCTVGALDDEPLFYMRSRGLSEDQAKRLLMRSFLFDTIKDIENDDIRQIFEAKLDRLVMQAEQGGE